MNSRQQLTMKDDDKLKNFIPTKAALELLEEILLSTNPNSTERARVLIGAADLICRVIRAAHVLIGAPDSSALLSVQLGF